MPPVVEMSVRTFSTGEKYFARRRASMEKLTDAIGELQEMSARNFSTGEKCLA
jgi:hypothetical protein